MLLPLLLACSPVPSAPAPAPGAPASTTAAAESMPPVAAPGPPPEGRPAPARLVAIGDLHGDLEAALAVFRLAGLVDDGGAWSGGAAWLVQTGDITDRGPDSRGVIALLRRLQGEARAAGGEVVPLLGNHEVMNLTGDWRYVSPADLASYGGEAVRKAAFAPTGDDGAWLVAQDAVARVGSTVFVHGGVDERWSRLGVRGLNATIRAALLGQGPKDVLGPDGPLWNRAYVLSDPTTACAELGRALTSLGAARMVVGHTTQEDGRIGERCGGQLWAIDTGISAHYGTHLAALEIRAERVSPLYPSP
ncbi:MAG: metallophosphoesterase [Pseudomonadota bacterium]|nr:metallophosphoesterase [Pseudomonadota bacterium]